MLRRTADRDWKELRHSRLWQGSTVTRASERRHCHVHTAVLLWVRRLPSTTFPAQSRAAVLDSRGPGPRKGMSLPLRTALPSAMGTCDRLAIWGSVQDKMHVSEILWEHWDTPLQGRLSQIAGPFKLCSVNSFLPRHEMPVQLSLVSKYGLAVKSLDWTSEMWLLSNGPCDAEHVACSLRPDSP